MIKLTITELRELLEDAYGDGIRRGEHAACYAAGPIPREQLKEEANEYAQSIIKTVDIESTLANWFRWRWYRFRTWSGLSLLSPEGQEFSRMARRHGFTRKGD